MCVLYKYMTCKELTFLYIPAKEVKQPLLTNPMVEKLADTYGEQIYYYDTNLDLKTGLDNNWQVYAYLLWSNIVLSCYVEVVTQHGVSRS